MDAVGLVSPSLLDQRLKFSDFTLVLVEEWLRVGNLEDDLWLGEGVGKVETGVSAILNSLLEEGVEFGLEQSVADVLFESVLGLAGHNNLMNNK